MDDNYTDPIGIDAMTLRFLDVFLLHCLLADSPPDTPSEIRELAQNQHLTAARGREPGLELLRRGQPVKLTDWGLELIEQLQPIADALDELEGTDAHALAVAHAEFIQMEVLGERPVVVPHVHRIACRAIVRAHHHRPAGDRHHRIADIALDVDAAMPPTTAARRTEFASPFARLVGLVDVAIARRRPRQSAFARLRFLRLGAVALLFGQRELLRDGVARARVGVAGGVSTAVQEAGLQATQETRTAEESALNIGASVVLGGLLGGGANLLTRAEHDTASAALHSTTASTSASTWPSASISLQPAGAGCSACTAVR